MVVPRVDRIQNKLVLRLNWQQQTEISWRCQYLAAQKIAIWIKAFPRFSLRLASGFWKGWLVCLLLKCITSLVSSAEIRKVFGCGLILLRFCRRTIQKSVFRRNSKGFREWIDFAPILPKDDLQVWLSQKFERFLRMDWFCSDSAEGRFTSLSPAEIRKDF